jgi:hypothetical protein
MASIVEWQSLRMQEYRYSILESLVKIFAWFGIRRLPRYEKPAEAGAYDEALHIDHPEARSFLDQYLDNHPTEPKLGGRPKQTAPGESLLGS